MKSITKILGIGALVLGSAQTTQAQASASATAEATIIAPITLIKAVDMNFGNVAVNASSGTVVLPASASPTRSATGGITLPSTTGTVQAALFNVGGEALFTYAITLPASLTITKAGGGATMTVNSFTSSPSGTGALDALGAEDLYVGAQLNVSGSQAAGVYTSLTPFSVTVNYN